MTDKRKKLARELSKKTGMSHQAAINALAAGASPPPVMAPQPRVDRSVAQLLSALRTDSTFGVLVGRTTSAASATFEVAAERSRELARHPQYFAETGPMSLSISESERTALLAAGAAEAGAVQVMRAFTVGRMETVSERCEGCNRWVWCFSHDGEVNVEGACYCGHRYRVVFDATIDWTRPFGPHCMDCGIEHRLSQPHENLNPWRVVNERQWQCNACSTKEARQTAPPTGPTAH